MKPKNKLVIRISIFLLITFVSSLIVFSDKAKSQDEKVPVLKVTSTQSTITAGVNEEFAVTYHVEPQPIPLDKISPQTEKEIVLVIDTSGSMSSSLDSKNTRIEALKTAAKNFVDKFSGNDKVYLGIVDYDTDSTVITNTTTFTDGFINESTNNIDIIKKLIDTKLDAKGGTNIGEGIRKGLGLLNRSNNRKKYIIVMSDGEPTALTYTGQAGYYKNSNKTKYESGESYDSTNGFWAWSIGYVTENDKWSYYTSLSDNTSTMKYGGIYSNQNDPGWFLKYSNLMAAQIKQKQYTSYFIGFSSESNANKLSQISTNAGGIYLSAQDATAIDQVYSSIADQIKADYMVEQVNFNFSLPADLTYTGSQLNISANGSSYSKQLPNITYTLNSAKTYYEAQPFDIVINLKALKSGTYNLTSSNGWNITYKSVGGTIVNEVTPNIQVVVRSLNTNFNLNRTILNNTTNTINLNNNFQFKYTITPLPVAATTAAKGKEVVMVIDTSSSMGQDLNGESGKQVSEQKLSIVKDIGKKFIDSLKANPNVNVGLVTFNNGAVAANFSSSESTTQYLIASSNADSIKTKVDSLSLSKDANDGSNIGEGIRKALWILSKTTNTDKSIIVISDGKADYYTSEKANADNFYTVLDNETNYGTKLNYTEGSQVSADGIIKAEQYSKVMAQAIKNNPNQVIKPYFIGLGKNADGNLLTTLSTISNGNYKDCTANDKSILESSMVDIADVVRSEFMITDAALEETLVNGLQFEDSTTNKKVILPKLVYVYNTTSKKYEAEPIETTLTVKGIKLGNYSLLNDALFKYKDIEGNDMSPSFPSYSLEIVDSYVLKQGLFKVNPKDKTTIGESYLDMISKDISDNFITKLGTYIRTTGKPTSIKISINKDSDNNLINSKITSIESVSVKVYKVNDKDNSLTDITTSTSLSIDNTVKNACIINVNVPAGDSSNYNHYIINYNFKTIGDTTKGYDTTCTSAIQQTGKSDSIILNAVGLPDLF